MTPEGLNANKSAGPDFIHLAVVKLVARIVCMYANCMMPRWIRGSSFELEGSSSGSWAQE